MLIRLSLYVCYALALGACTFTWMGTLAHWDWRLELLSHPRPAYVLGLSPGLLFSVLMQHWRWFSLFVLSLVLNIALIIPVYFAVEPPAVDKNQQSIGLTHFNLDRFASEPERALKVLNETGDDIIFLQEVTPALVAEMIAALPDYQVQSLYPLPSSAGSALFVKRDSPVQIEQTAFISLPHTSERRLISVRLHLDQQPIHLLSLHVIRPRNAWTSSYQAEEFAALAQWAQQRQKAGEAVLIVGDFNTTPWSQRFQQLLKQGHLLNGQRGYGLQATWPAAFPLLPIDLCIHSQPLMLTHYAAGQTFSGDHKPLHIHFQLRK